MSKTFETNWNGMTGRVVDVGGGVSASTILEVLQNVYMGGVKICDDIKSQIICGEGPIRFYHCYQHYPRPQDSMPTLREVRDQLANDHDGTTFEVGLRWLLQDPSGEKARGKGFLGMGGAILVIDHRIPEVDGKIQVLNLTRGYDGPVIFFRPLDLNMEWDKDDDYLSSREIRPCPYVS